VMLAPRAFREIKDQKAIRATVAFKVRLAIKVILGHKALKGYREKLVPKENPACKGQKAIPALMDNQENKA